MGKLTVQSVNNRFQQQFHCQKGDLMVIVCVCVGLDDDFMVIQWDLNCNLIGVHADFVVIL